MRRYINHLNSPAHASPALALTGLVEKQIISQPRLWRPLQAKTEWTQYEQKLKKKALVMVELIPSPEILLI